MRVNVTTAAFARAAAAGSGSAGQLSVPVGATFPFGQAPAALARLSSHHPSGKLALIV